MGVRLNKVLSELNIGLQTAVDFLKKKSSLGEIRDDATTNTKISDEQYQALVDEFSTDKAVKTQADMIFTKKAKEKKVEKAEKAEKAVTKTEEMLEQRTGLKTLGKIDLSQIGKPKAAPTPEQEPEPEPEPEPVKEEEPQVIQEAPIQEQPVVEDEDEDVAEESADNVEPSLAKTPGDFIKPATQLNVLGKIDLDSLNQSTLRRSLRRSVARSVRRRLLVSVKSANASVPTRSISRLQLSRLVSKVRTRTTITTKVVITTSSRVRARRTRRTVPSSRWKLTTRQ